MRKTLLLGLAVAAIALASAAPSQATLFCPVLKSPDGFVALRSGPGAHFRIVARMKEDDEVQVLDAYKGPWTQVRHWWGAERLEPATRDKFRSGWVHRRYVGDCG